MANKPKYTLVTISGIHTQIAKTTSTEGYTEGIIEVFLPEDEEMENWDDAQQNKWIAQSNKRMKAICDFLNNNNF